MPRKRVLVGFGISAATYKERPKAVFYRSATAAWWSFLLFLRAVGALLAPSLRKRHVGAGVRVFQLSFCTAVAGAGLYVYWHPVWLIVGLVVLIVLAVIEEKLTPTIE